MFNCLFTLIKINVTVLIIFRNNENLDKELREKENVGIFFYDIKLSKVKLNHHNGYFTTCNHSFACIIPISGQFCNIRIYKSQLC